MRTWSIPTCAATGTEGAIGSPVGARQLRLSGHPDGGQDALNQCRNDRHLLVRAQSERAVLERHLPGPVEPALANLTLLELAAIAVDLLPEPRLAAIASDLAQLAGARSERR